jgi:RimJ/RimL family protein N-acetyltransferase
LTAREAAEVAEVILRDVIASDLSVLFEQQLDPAANHMAAFTAKDPTDRDAFMAKWTKIMRDETIPYLAIVVDGRVAGSILSYRDPELAKPEVSYWIGAEYWDKGIATVALGQFLDVVRERPIYARAATDNVASVRVLEKCGFCVVGSDRGFANARGEEIDEVLLELRG